MSLADDGYSIAISGMSTNGTGYTRVYRMKDTPSWIMMTDFHMNVTISPFSGPWVLGHTLAISGDGSRVVGGTPAHDSNAVSAQVYERADACCARDERVVAHACVACPNGTMNTARDDWSKSDTTCGACSRDFHVQDNACVACPVGAVNPPGDDWSGPNTTCGCPADHHVLDHACVPCSFGEKNDGGDDPMGANTTCDVPPMKFAEGNWTQLGDDIYGEAQGDASGKAVAVSGDGKIVAVGAYLNDGTGD